MQMYSYLVEGLGAGQWRWTVFGGDHKAVRSGTNNSEHNAKMAALTAIDDLKKIDAEKNQQSS
jgi:hypothetical protein